MSTTKHTPAPWTYNENFAQEIVGADGLHIAYVGANDEPSQFRTDEEHDANARLIAEAPALLAALKHIAGHWEAAEESGNIEYAIDLVTCEECKQLALTAIARAEGRA